MKVLSISVVFILSLFVFTAAVDAKVLPRFAKSKVTKTAVKSKSAPGITISPRLRYDRKALNITFGNLRNAKDVSYTLIYQTNGKDEGISGSVDVSQGSATRELLFGTCSSGVCRYHSNITNMRLEVATELPSGKRLLKKYKIKV